MNAVNPWAVVASVLAVFVASAVYYSVFAEQRSRLSPAAAQGPTKPTPAQMLLEMLRNVVLALVIAYLLSHMAGATLIAAGGLALLLWVGFPVILLSGSVMYENVPARLAAIHAGDWLIKLLVMSALIGLWHG